MKPSSKILGVVAAALLGVGAVACGSAGILGGSGGGNPAPTGSYVNDIVGEVQSVDARANDVVVRTDQGQVVTVDYRNDAQVLYRGQTYQPANLEYGDYVRVHVLDSYNGARPVTDSIEVIQKLAGARHRQQRRPAVGNLSAEQLSAERLSAERQRSEHQPLPADAAR